MRFRRKNSSANKRSLDMTPMIDCVFQLLLFFMVSSHFDEESKATGEGSLDANLPEAAAAMPMVMRPREMIVNINARGEFYVGGEKHSEAQLAERLRRSAVVFPCWLRPARRSVSDRRGPSGVCIR